MRPINKTQYTQESGKLAHGFDNNSTTTTQENPEEHRLVPVKDAEIPTSP
jgi:hypothetical protein